MHDLQRNVDCELDGPADDGACIPAPIDIGVGDYGDSACTVPVYSMDARCPSPFAVENPAADCTNSFEVRLVTGTATGPTYTNVASDGSKGPCVPSAFSPGFSTLDLGPPVDRSSFPSLQRSAIGSGRLQAYAWSARDSEVLHVDGLTMHDSKLGIDCSVDISLELGGVRRCWPFLALTFDPYGFRYYGDPSCARELVEAPSTCAVPSFAVRFDEQGVATALYSVGEPYTGSLYARDTNPAGACKGATQLSPGTWFYLGSPEAPDTVAPIEEIQE